MNWNALSERKPEHKQRVIVFCYQGKELRRPWVSVATYHAGDDYNEEGWMHPMRGFVEITHWMPVPKFPGQENVNESGGFYYDLFEFFAEQHDLTLLDSEIQDIIHAVNKFEKWRTTHFSS